LDISSANIPAVSFVFTAIVPAFGDRRTEMKPSILPGPIGFPIAVIKTLITGRNDPFQRVIASLSQMEERRLEMPSNAIPS
jgi:hypothetical protein